MAPPFPVDHHLSVFLCNLQKHFHGARIPPNHLPGLHVVLNTALSFSIEQSQKEARCIIKEAGDGSSFAARGDLTHGDVSRGIAGR